jgi:hypothetical protein
MKKPITNVYVKSQNEIFEYANKPLFIKNKTFAKYFTLSHKFNDFPLYVKDLDRKYVTIEALKAVTSSYKISQLENAYYIEDGLHALY